MRSSNNKNRLFFILTAFVAFILMGSLSANSQNVVPSTVKVNELSNAQVKQAKDMLDNSGLSKSAAIEVARQKGASEQQIQEMMQRIDALEGNTPATQEQTLQIEQTEAATAEEPIVEETAQAKKAAGYSNAGARFGAYLFNSNNLTFEPSPNISTPKNYIINIGDQVVVSIWGNSQATYQLVVNRNGQVQIPDVGPVYIAGLPFEEAEKKLSQKLSTIYADMQGGSPRTFAQIDLGKMRSIKVNIVGEATTPGTYTLPATASVFNALFLSGGPGNIGSLRNIRLIRDGKAIKTIDIYRYLIDGDESENMTLRDEDIIFIPTVEKQVKVSGEFKRNALFELQENETLANLITYAGGYTDETYLYRMKLYRKTQTGSQLIDFTQSEIASTPLLNGDMLVAEKILNVYQNRVSIAGAIWRPGDYELTNGLKLSELIQKADSITPDAYYKGGHVIRANNDGTSQFIPFILADLLDGKTDIALENEDQVVIKSHFQMKEQSTITVSGEVNSPFSSTFTQNMTLRDAIYLANGFKEGADSTSIEVSRRLGYEKESHAGDTLRAVFQFTLSRDLNFNDEASKFLLNPFDRISVRRAPGYREPEEVTIIGEVKYAGRYALNTKNLRISDLVEKAGGLTQEAYPEAAQFQRNAGMGNEKIGIELHKILKGNDGKSDLLLTNGDVLIIPKKLQTVKVTGNILNPMSMTYEEGKTLKYYIDKSGGFNERTRKNKVYVMYPNGTTAVTKTFLFRTYPKVKPGSQIVVPAKPEKQYTDNTGKWLAFASTMSSVAIAISYFLK